MQVHFVVCVRACVCVCVCVCVCTHLHIHVHITHRCKIPNMLYTSDKIVSRPNQRGISVQGTVYTKVDKKDIYIWKTS